MLCPICKDLTPGKGCHFHYAFALRCCQTKYICALYKERAQEYLYTYISTSATLYEFGSTTWKRSYSSHRIKRHHFLSIWGKKISNTLDNYKLVISYSDILLFLWFVHWEGGASMAHHHVSGPWKYFVLMKNGIAVQSSDPTTPQTTNGQRFGVRHKLNKHSMKTKYLFHIWLHILKKGGNLHISH